MGDDVASGAVRYLSGIASVTSLLGSFPATDPIAANAGKPYLFKGDASGYRGLLVRLQSTSGSAIVCSAYGGYSVAPPMTTPRHLRLSVEVFVDPLRDSGYNISETSGATESRGRAVWDAVLQALQRTDPDTVLWGDLVTTGCQLLTEPLFMMLQGGDGDGLLRGQGFFGVDTFGRSDSSAP